MGVTRAQAELAVDNFNNYFETLSPEDQRDLYGGKPASLDSYICPCGSKNFRLAVANEVPRGSTVNPVIVPDQLLKEPVA